MIVSSILNLLKTVISGLLNLLPSSPEFVSGSISSFINLIAPLNTIFPIQELLNFFVFLISIISLFLLFWAINRVINLIRGAG